MYFATVAFIYISYFAGGNQKESKSKYNGIINSFGFVLGFTIRDEAISHGCVRLSLDDAKYIYDTIPARNGIKIIK